MSSDDTTTITPSDGNGHDDPLQAELAAAYERVLNGDGPLPTRPVIDLTGGELADRVAASIAALQGAKVAIFNRGGQLVRPVRVAGLESLDGVRRSSDALILRPVEPEWLRLRLDQAAVWRRWDGRSKQYKIVDPPYEVARAIVAAADEGGWPSLRAIVRHPVLLPDGRRLEASGYDTTSELLVDAPGHWPPLPSPLTRTSAIEARGRIEDLLRFFPWASDIDKAVALSMLLTALARPILSVAPGHGTDAPTPGTGKSLLVDAAAIVATGTTAAVMAWGRDRDEASKRLDGMLLSGDGVISIDNIESVVDGDTLCQSLSQATRRVRPLGGSEMVTVPCTALITLNGNNLTLRGDIVRRVVVCRLDADCERPELREIPQDLLAEVHERRGEIVRDVQTIQAAYIAAGRPRLKLPPFGGYVQWTALVRKPLVWSGAADPVAAMERTRADDPSRQEVHAVFAAWHAAFGTDPTTAAEAVARTETAGAVLLNPTARDKASQRLKQALDLVATRGGRLDAKTLSYWLRSYRDQRAGAYVLHRNDTRAHGGFIRWKVVKTGGDG
jgi:putative DNA primase/helicase